MSTQNPFADPNFGRSDAPVNGQPSASNPFADPEFGKAPATPKRSIMAAINDTVIEGANAAAGTASAIGNFVRPGNAASQWIDKNIVEAGEAAQSDVVKAEKARYAQEMQAADGMVGEVGATLGYVARNPLLAAAQAAGSFAVPGAAIKGATTGARALGLGAKGATRAGLAAAAGVGAAGAGGDAAGTAYELSREGGATDEQAVAAARGASVLPAAIGAAGGLVGAERLVAGAGGFKGGLVARALKTGAVEGAQEALEEGVTQYEGQRAAVPFNPDLDPMKGVAGAATMGGVLGAATGAGASLLTRDSRAPVRKPSEDLGLDPNNGPLSKVAAAAVDEGRAAAPMQPAQPEGGLSLQPVEQPETPAAPSMAERLEALPQQARTQADQLLREIADERTPEGVKRFRANELQQLLDANPMPQVPSMDISQEDRIATGPIVRGFDPSTGQAPARPLELVDAQPQYEGGIDFEQQPQAEPSSLIQLAEWYERSAQGNRDAANPVDQVQQQVRQGTQYTDAAQVQAARQAVEDAWLSLNAGESASQAQADGGPGVEAAPADLTAETNARLRAGRVASGVRNAFDDGAPNTLRVIQYVNQGLRTIGEQPLTSPEIARIRRLADARTTFAGLNQPAPLPADRQTTPTDTAADNSSMESLIPVRRAAAQSTTTQQGNANGTAAPFDNAPQTVAPSPAQSQAPAPAFPQPAGVADATQATQAQQTGAQPQAPGAATAEGAGQAAPAQATPVERKRSAGDLARSRSYAANPMRAFLGKHGVSLNSRSEFAPGLQELRGTLVPGYGPMFRKNGKPLDTLVQNAIEEGFLPEGATESELYDLIDRAVRRGERVAPMYTESAAESEFEAMAARQAEFAREDYEADRAAQDAEAAEYDAVLAQKYTGMTDEEFAALEAGVPNLDAGSNMSIEDAMRALGFSEKEIQDAITQKQGVAPEGGQRTGRAVEADTRGAQARIGASQGDALQSYTEAELKQRQEAQEKAEAEAAKAEREAQAKEKAERERKEISARQDFSAENFELGQDPMASLSGQTSIFDAPQELAKAQAKTAPKQETAAGKDSSYDRAKALGIKGLRVGMKQDALKRRVKAFLAGERASNLVEAGKKTDLPQYQGVPDTSVRDFAELVDANQYSIDTSDAAWVLDARGMSGIDALVESGLLKEGDAKYKHALTPVGKEIARRLLTKPIGDMSTSDMLDEIDAGNAANDDQAETSATIEEARQGNAAMFSRSAGSTDTEAQRQFKETERAYGGKAAYDRAKAAGKTKLTYGQWVQVRTPNFKAWFGDWQNAGHEASQANSTADTKVQAGNGASGVRRLPGSSDVGPTVDSRYAAVSDTRGAAAPDGPTSSAREGGEALRLHDIGRGGETTQVGNTGGTLALLGVQREKGVDTSAGVRAAHAGEVGKGATFSGASGPTAADGSPLRLYHGTRDDFSSFDLSHPRRKDHGWLGSGIYLTSSPDTAFEYSRAKRGGGSSNVMPLYANVRNPYVATEAEKNSIKKGGPAVAQAFTERVKALGHDGVVMGQQDGGIELVAFEPTQVKSATGNNGNFDPASPDIRYSRSVKPATNPTAVKMRRAMVQRTVGSLTQGWGQSPRITVVDSMNDPRVPEAVREADQAQRSQGATGEPEGFWYQGQVYLVASALPTSADATRVLYHEVLGHHGLRGHFGAELDKVLDQVAKLRRKDVAAKASEYGLDMGNPDHVAYAAEEVLAELAQTRPDLGFVQRAIAAIRNFLRSHVPGFKALELTDADIVQGYLLPARGWVERGGNTGTGPRAADTPFSRNATAVEDRNLVVVHNLSASNLMHAEELGGLAVPSLAIARVDAPLDGFGEITLVGDSAMATPGAKNPVFDADVYSPRFPSVKVKVNEKVVRDALAPLMDAARAAGLHARSPASSINEMERNRLSGAIDQLSYDAGLRLGFANAVQKKSLAVPMRDVAPPPTANAQGSLAQQSPLMEYLANVNVGQMKKEDSAELAQKVYAALFNRTYARFEAESPGMATAEMFDKVMAAVNRRIGMFADTTIDQAVHDLQFEKVGLMHGKGLLAIHNLQRNTDTATAPVAAPSQEVDYEALRELLDAEVPRESFDAWLREKLTPAMGERRVEKENGRTAAYTMENIVREMTRKVRDSEGFNYGLGNARSKGATKFKNLRQIQGQRDRVVPREQFEAARKELEAEFKALTEAVTPFQRYERDSAFELLAEAIGNSYTMPMERALEQATLIGVPEALRTRISAFGAALVNAPTEYFEAKPQRAVQFNEFRGAVIPSDTTPEVREVLERRGLQLQEYKSGDAEGRRAAVGRLAEQLNADKGDVLFSRSQPADAIRSSMGSLTADQERKASWAAPSASQWDDLTYKLQDKHIDTKRVLESIRATGKAIGDDLDVYLQEELYHGRAAKRTEDFVAQELEPLVRYMSGAGLKMPELEEFLHARHAKEANAVIAQRNPDLPDGGSGMTNAEADAVMAAYSPTKRSLLGKAAEKVDAIIAQTRQTFVEYGLESQDTVDAWSQTFAHYVPLMREQEGDGMAGLGTGQGFSVKGKEVKGRTGSTKKVVDILANIAMQRERAIVRGEKNRVAAALVGLAKANPSGFWKVDVVPTRQVLGKDGMVKTEHDPLYKQRDNVVVAKIPEVDAKTGKVVVKEHAVLFDENDARALRMAQALKNLDAAQLEGMLGATAKVTRYLAAINTQYNPIFGVTNLARDLQGAAINLQSTELAGRHGEVLAQSLPALRGIYSEMRAQRKGETTGTPWSQLWEEFQGVGGQTGYRDQFRTSADRGEAIEKALDPGSWADSGLGKLFTANGALKVPMEFARQKAQWLFQWLEDYNTAMENGVRLATYKAGLDAGLSKERAASIAKNLTTNFNRKGQVAQQVGALYAFFNASMQGTARIGQALFTMEPGKPKTMRLSPLGKKVVFGGVTLGVMQALLLAAAGFDEVEPQEFVRERNLIIPVGGKKYITIPMPLGLHVLPNLGRIPAEFAMSGFQNPSATAIKVMSLFADAFNPMGSAGLSMQTLVPTVLDPLAALAENKDFSGRSIAKESFNQATPGHALGRDSASALATWVAQAINFLSGGTQYVRGEFSPTPDQIEYLVGQATGGVGRELLKLQSTAKGLMDGDEVPPHKVPLLGRFYGDSDTPSAKQATFYGHMDSVRRHAEQVKGLRLDGNASEALAYAASHPEARLAFAARKASQDVQKMRELRRELELQGASKEAIRNIDQRMVQRMELFNELVGRTVGAS